MRKALLAVLIAAWSGAACAEVVVGISVSSTGPGASLGTHIAKVVPLLPKTVAGEAVRYIMLDDASDPTVGARNARKLRHLLCADEAHALLFRRPAIVCRAVVHRFFLNDLHATAHRPSGTAPRPA